MRNYKDFRVVICDVRSVIFLLGLERKLINLFLVFAAHNLQRSDNLESQITIQKSQIKYNLLPEVKKKNLIQDKHQSEIQT